MALIVELSDPGSVGSPLLLSAMVGVSLALGYFAGGMMASRRASIFYAQRGASDRSAPGLHDAPPQWIGDHRRRGTTTKRFDAK
jgi:hypothetical protein